MKKKNPQTPNRASPNPFKERRVYLFRCSVCGRKKAQSFKRRRARGAVCRKCRRNAVHPNQMGLPLGRLENGKVVPAGPNDEAIGIYMPVLLPKPIGPAGSGPKNSIRMLE